MRAIALFGVPSAFALGGFAAYLFTQSAPAHLSKDFAQPLVVVTAWGPYGLVLFTVLAITLGLGALAIVFALGPAWRAGPSLGATLVLAALALAAALAWPVIFSSDLYAYAAYGDLAIRGHNPYLPLSRGYHDAFVDAARWQWGGASFPACVYGPLFVALASASAFLGGDRLVPTLGILRGSAAFAYLAGIVVFNDVLAGKPYRRAAVAAYALNPIVVWSVAEGHNDAVLLLAVLTGFALLRRRAARSAGIVLAATVAFKAVGVVAAFASALWLFGKRSLKTLGFLGGVAIGLALAAALVLPFQLKSLNAIAGSPHVPEFSFASLVGPLATAIVVIAASITGLRALLRGETVGALWLALGIWLAIPNPYPWYSLWIAPLALAFPPSRVSFAFWAGTITSAIRYLPEAFGDVPHLTAGILTLIQLAPLAFAIPTSTSMRLAEPEEPARTR